MDSFAGMGESLALSFVFFESFYGTLNSEWEMDRSEERRVGKEC